MNRFIVLLWFTLIGITAFAQTVEFKATADKVVEVGEQFRITYTVNADASGFRAPDFTDFEVLMGPAQYTNSSFQMINGKTTQNFSISYTFIVEATKKGSFTIQPAQITVDGKTYKSNALSIEVIGAGSSQQNNNDAVTEIKGNPEDLFVRINCNKTTVYQGEHVIATMKIYTRLNLVGFEDIKFPSFTGFWSQDIENPTQISLDRENINGKVYNAGLLKQNILFPQQTGVITIDPMTVQCVVQQKAGQVRNFWGQMVDQYQNVSKNLKSPLVKINVLPLPDNKPLDFCGAVGSDFKISATIDKENVKLNEGLTLKVDITGTGNLRLIDQLKIDIPTSLEKYEPKIDDQIKYSVNGAFGKKSFEYVIIAREPGEFRIAPITLSYFNPAQKRYITISTKEFKIKVEGTKDQTNTGNYSTIKTDVQDLGKDIQFIYQNNFQLYEKDKGFTGSSSYYFFYVLAITMFAGIIIWKRRQIKRNADLLLVKNKNANKVSRKRLRAAEIAMKENNFEHFHEEVLKALWGYISDKLSIPVSELSHEKIVEELQKRNVKIEVITKLIEIIDACEFARYAPKGSLSTMENLFADAENTINKLENQLR